MSLHIVDGRTVVAQRRGPLARIGRFLAEPFKDAWHHRDLLLAILQRELAERFKGSVAGWVWAVTAPLLSLIVYTVAFSGAVRLPSGEVSGSNFDYALFIFGGLIAFNFFSEMAYRAPSLLHEYAHFIKQTMFPAEMLPIISTLRATAYASIGLVLMLVAQLVLTGTLHWTVLLLPIWYIPFIAFLIGMTWTLSAMGAFTRDTAYLMMTVAPLLMFATPVFYSTDQMSETLKLVFYINILTGFIEVLRDIVVFGQLPNPLVCAWVLFLSVATFYFGFWFFGKQRDGIADVI
ncbi:ABC transporter permease [Enhydrobacter aerosaccus]|uniref:ABC transporter permease n=1 Tax=Enhydrobacter aerosaccus TaxID=225324 RepID=UPI000A2EFA22|nr:ABC transporter permease [Enhydrobacter aerosaccus]